MLYFKANNFCWLLTSLNSIVPPVSFIVSSLGCGLLDFLDENCSFSKFLTRSNNSLYKMIFSILLDIYIIEIFRLFSFKYLFSSSEMSACIFKCQCSACKNSWRKSSTYVCDWWLSSRSISSLARSHSSSIISWTSSTVSVFSFFSLECSMSL